MLSLIGANVTRMPDKIKHVFERVAKSRWGNAENLSEGLVIVGDTLEKMFGIRTCDRVQFEHKSE